MKVRDLIVELLAFDMDAEVLLMAKGECLTPVGRVANQEGARPILESDYISQGKPPGWGCTCKHRRA